MSTNPSVQSARLLGDIGKGQLQTIADGFVSLAQAEVYRQNAPDGHQYPPSTRIMDGEDEVVFKVQGVMCGKLLPPFTESPVSSPRSKGLSRIRNLRQHVKVTGFGSSEYDAYMDKLQTVHDAFAQHARDREVDQIEFIPYEGHSRWRALVPYEKNQAFLPGWTPSTSSGSCKPDEFIHAADNVVEYCVRAVANGSTTYGPCEPSVFKVGDVVEVAFSCVGVPIKGQRMRILLQLRGLTLLDNTIRKESERTTRMTMALVALNRTPRRKRLYLTEEEVCGDAHGTKRTRRSEDSRERVPAPVFAPVTETEVGNEEGEIIEVEGSDGSSTVGGGEGDGDGAAEGEADGEGEGGGDVEGNEGEDDSAEAVSGGELEEGEMLPDLPDSDDEDVHGVEGEGGGDDAAEAGERGDAMNVD
ncbi:hypothetical protein D9611_015080 [Ephemerocybe angulata]|uniref:Uncharacterized protein n=1 Tax=Ephemerocybe angulata TaxID=980116 RepID=A0A8H5C4U3_9AGAR|nr:hypothetical protein D9611_015080 [Tulosesus angulatus]